MIHNFFKKNQIWKKLKKKFGKVHTIEKKEIERKIKNKTRKTNQDKCLKDRSNPSLVKLVGTM